MISILVVSHGKMAEGMLDSLALIMGTTTQIDYASLVAGQDIEQFKEEVVTKIEQMNDGDGVLVFVDLFGASPYNASQYASMKLTDQGVKIRVLTGMNLPMLLETVALRETYDLNDLSDYIMNSGRENIMQAASISEVADDEEGDY